MSTLIDLYVNAVGEHLPGKLSADIQAEIRSSIEDTLEARSQATGRAPDAAMVAEVLKEFGAPAKMAAAYLPQRYLIGPRWFPAFWLVLRIALGIVALLGVVQLAVALSQGSFAVQRLDVGNYINFAFAALGNVVLVFGLLEWVQSKLKEKDGVWNPESLRENTQDEKPGTIGLAVDMVLILAAALIFNFFPQWISMFQFEPALKATPILTDAFFRYLPWINLLWGLQVGLNLLLMRTGRVTPLARWLRMGLRVYTIALLAVMIAGAPVVKMPILPDFLNQLAPTALMGLLMALQGIDLFKDLRRALGKAPTPAIG